MDIQEEKNKDLTPSMLNEINKPHKTWFIERYKDGYIFASGEEEA